MMTIKISEKNKTELDKLKKVSCETYNSVIERLINDHELTTGGKE